MVLAPPDLVHDWDDRVENDKNGAAYYDVELAGDLPTWSGAVVGMAYQIVVIDNIDVSRETFDAVYEVHYIYKISGNDKEKYEQAQGWENFSFQRFFDYRWQGNGRGKGVTKPPILEARNAIGEVQVMSERVHSFHGPDDSGDFCVQLYGQYRATCKETMELSMFPFTRQCLQIRLVSKVAFDNMLFVPWNAFQEAMAKKFAIEPRSNTLKAEAEVQSWTIEAHHVAFVPKELAPKMPSGKRYPRIYLCTQARLCPQYFLWNVFFIIFLLTSLSASIVAVPQKDAADRMSILLALILSVAAYKSSVAGMLPAKKYLTRLDKYIITAFCGLFVVSVWVAILALASDEDYGGPIVPVTTEITVLGCGLVIWLACHVYLLCCSDNLYPSWGEVIRDENDQLKSAKDCVEKRRMESSKDSSQQEPVRENTGDSEAGDEDLEAERGRKHGKRMQPGVPEGRRDDDPRKQPGVPEEAAWLS